MTLGRGLVYRRPMDHHVSRLAAGVVLCLGFEACDVSTTSPDSSTDAATTDGGDAAPSIGEPAPDDAGASTGSDASVDATVEAGCPTCGPSVCTDGHCPAPIPASGLIAVHPTGKFVFAHAVHSESLHVLTVDPDHVLSETAAAPAVELTGASGSLVIDPSGRFLYLADAINHLLYAFSIGPLGTLTPILGSPFTTGNVCNFAHVDRHGERLYLSCGGSQEMFAWSIEPGSGTLATVAGSPFDVGAVDALIGNQDFVLGPAGFVYVVDDRQRFGKKGEPGRLFGFSGAWSSADVVAGTPMSTDGFYPRMALAAPSSDRLYVTNAAGVAGFSIDATTGTLTAIAGSPWAVQNPIVMVEDAAASFLLTMSGPSITVFKVDSAGALTSAGTSTAAGDAKGIAFDASGSFVYALTPSSVDTFSLDRDSGALMPVASIPLD